MSRYTIKCDPKSETIYDQVDRLLYNITSEEAIANGICIRCKVSIEGLLITEVDKREWLFGKALCPSCRINGKARKNNKN